MKQFLFVTDSGNSEFYREIIGSGLGETFEEALKFFLETLCPKSFDTFKRQLQKREITAFEYSKEIYSSQISLAFKKFNLSDLKHNKIKVNNV